MLPTLILAVALVPQDPLSENAREIHAALEVTGPVEAALRTIDDVGEGRIAAVRTPRFLRELRRTGLAAADRAAAALAPGEQPEDVLELAIRLWGERGRGVPGAPERLDLRDFENLCEHAFRDLTKALGSGRELDKEAPRLHGAVESLRKSIRNLSDLDREDERTIRERLERAETVDQDAIVELARRVVRGALALDRPGLIEQLRRQETRDPRATGGVEGEVLVDRDTAFGRMVVGGFGRNSYDASQVEVIVDLGGDDTYRGPAGGAGELRRMAVVVDVSGNDTYEALNDALGSATFGLGVLVDLDGEDSYRAASRGAGFGAAGAGVLLDLRGDDRYELGDQCGGVGLAGLGLFLDLAGDDWQRAGVQSFGCGLPGGLGLFVDGRGKDRRLLGAEEKSLTESGQESVSLGLGAGVGYLPLLSGGLGVCIDGAGDDRYEAAGLVVGCGLRGGGGVFLDRQGDDVYRGGVASFGAAYGHGIGVCLDDAGDDDYRGHHLSLGAASAGGLAWFVDAAGEDRYEAVAPALGEARRAAIACFLDRGGTDHYRASGNDIAWQLGSLRSAEAAAVGLFLDEGGGQDEYDFVKVSAPQNDGRRMLETGKAPAVAYRILIDR